MIYVVLLFVGISPFFFVAGLTSYMAALNSRGRGAVPIAAKFFWGVLVLLHFLLLVMIFLGTAFGGINT